MSSLIPFLITEAVLGGLIWVISLLGIDGTIKTIMRAVVILFAILYLVQFLGLYHFGLPYLIPHIGG